MTKFGDSNKWVEIGQTFDWVTGGTPGAKRTAILEFTTYPMFSSRSNPFKHGHYVGGGPFISVKIRSTLHGDSATVFRPSWGKAYSGMFLVAVPSQSGPNMGSSYVNVRYNAFKGLGATAWNRLRPDKPDFTLALSLMELKDMPDMLKDAVRGIRDSVRKVDKQRRSKGRSGLSKTGQFYLAVQFGWLPVLSDVRNFVRAQKHKQQRLAQLIRDNGRPIHRSTTLEDTQNHYGGGTSDYADGWGANLSPSFVTQCYGPGPAFRRVHTNDSVKTWAEGVFRYHLPPGPHTVAWKKKMLRRIMGGRVTPDVIYNIMPWTWLVDYFTNLGDFVQAVSPGVADRLAADYCYLMQTCIYETHRDANAVVQGAMKSGSVINRPTATSSTYAIQKFRTYATPFGFGFTQSSMTPKQTAILGALGLSKLP